MVDPKERIERFLKEWMLDEEPFLSPDGLEEAFLGAVQVSPSRTTLLFSRPKAIQILMRDGMTEEQAEEHFEFNVVGSWVGDYTPAWFLGGVIE